MFGNFCLNYSRRTAGARRNMAATLLCVNAFLVTASSVGTADTPLPRERPEIVPGEQAPTPESDIVPSPCQMRLAELASFKLSPAISGPGECAATDVVTVDA